ncbi:PREDICTED: WAP four-disulfide core domain protein 2 isoform X2 [Chinchilla lanigera]|uniref:WAP four-disulfide core domain protein 2 n=1 Tax=Chinchilla lanigera TaxID=34839 RepID=A0A8C2VB34_CHILA|nr:PREDICTED: WAP four-disulfide core domain protein 2 isoform X2 [Chinchilla lanigera]
MPVGRLCLLATAFLLGLLLPGLLQATATEAKKPGVCPQLQADRNCTLTMECNSDSDCAGNLKCCQGNCGTICSMPNEKPGTCPSVELPQLGICEDQCQEDSQCSGLMKCCRNGCGKVSCVTPNFQAPAPPA